MKKVFVILFTILFCLLILACPFSGTPTIISAKFLEDDILEIEYPILNSPIEINKYSITPDDGYRIVSTVYTPAKLKSKFNKPIPNGVLIELEVCDYDKERFSSYFFVKGEEKEEF
jgi:hypothetical protein